MSGYFAALPSSPVTTLGRADLVACNSETGSISQGREIITAPIYWAWKRFMIVEVDTNLTGTGH
jgi:hypothetical protein